MLVLYRAIRLVGDTADREPVVLVAALMGDRRDIQAQSVGLVARVHRRGPIAAVGALTVA